MTRAIVFAVGILVLVWIVAPGLRTPSSDSGVTGIARAPSVPAVASATIVRSDREIVIERGPEGHFTTQATVNGATFPMVLDSGASHVVLRRADALAAGISVFPSEFTGSAQTAGGTVRTKQVVLSRISIAGIERRNVTAAVVDADLPVSLLGQSFLAQLGEVRIAGDRMILR